MSWDFGLIATDDGTTLLETNYTSNMSKMVLTAYADAGGEWDGSFWKLIDGMEGPKGAETLNAIVRQLESDPARYKQLNPTNGWGDYDSFLAVLTKMRDSVPERPCWWSCSG